MCIKGGHISADRSKISSNGRGWSDTRQSANSACAGPIEPTIVVLEMVVVYVWGGWVGGVKGGGGIDRVYIDRVHIAKKCGVVRVRR